MTTAKTHPVVLLDGGMGRVLQERSLGFQTRSSIWSAIALLEAPNVVAEAHREYFDAGAEVITTSNYGVVPRTLAMENLTSRFDELTALSGEIAATVRDSSSRSVKVAGSLPPLNGSYSPHDVGPEEENYITYRQMVANLAPFGDQFVCETMSSGIEARAAARAAAEFSKPVWVAWTLDKTANGPLRSGETIKEALAYLDGLKVDACLFNCSTPEAISAALPVLGALTDAPIGGYANSFVSVRPPVGPLSLRPELTPKTYASIAAKWRKQGASILGGYCGIKAEYIAALRHRFPLAHH